MVIMYIEPALPHFAFNPGCGVVHWYDDIKDMADWVEWLYEDVKEGKTASPPPETFDYRYYNCCWVEMALEERLPWVCEILKR